MILAHFLTDTNEANMYVLGCEENHKALLIDAPTYDPRLAPFLDKHDLELEGIFITHEHYDHTGGLTELIRRYKATVYAGRERIAGVKARLLRQDDRITVGRIVGHVLELPGHTPCSIGLVMPGMVFTGDALFAGSIGGTTTVRDRDCETAHIQKHVLTLPDDFRIFPGHGPSSTVFVEKSYNPFFV